MSKHRPRLCRLGVLAPAALSVCMDASVLAVPAAGAIVSTVLKELSKAFMLKKWFHGVMSEQEAEELIMEMGKNGSFLVRESQAHPGEYALSVRVRGRVEHVIIRYQHNKYNVGSGEFFDDLVGLIEHFRSYPMTETSGDVLRLLQPVSGHRLRSYAIKRETEQAMERLTHDCHGSYDGEFETLKMLEERNTFTTNEGLKVENTMKNRYRNILPYDQTRVILRCRDEQENDYINANYVRSSCLRGSSTSLQSSIESLNSVQSLFVNSDTKKMTTRPPTKSLSDDALREAKNWFRQDSLNGNVTSHDVHDKMYIAAQGCLQNTIGDFWRMIWQEDVRVIAMITNEIEKGKRKCVRYWPNPGQEERHAGLLIRAIAETRHEKYLTRELELTDDNGVCRTVYQYQFTAWPDQGAPDDPHRLLAFLADINLRMAVVSQSKDPPEQNTLCVHCSAGVGRTGTFIVLDMLIDDLKYGGFPCAGVYAAVKHARAQRSGLVQNKTQYRFLYHALAAFLEANTLSKKVYTLDA